MAVTNCHLAKIFYDRLIKKIYGLTCNTEPNREVYPESYVHYLECETIDMTCYNTKPCDLTVCNLNICNITTQQTIQQSQVVNTNQFTFSVDLNQFINYASPFTSEWTYDNTLWQLNSQTVDSITLLATNENQAINTSISVTMTDAKGCKISLTLNDVQYLYGCTEIDAINYDPNANINDGTCFVNSLKAIVGYNCNAQGNGVMYVTPTGGVPPYTVIGTQNGEIVNAGNNYNLYVVDSLGYSTPIYTGTIVCPPDCNQFNIIVGLAYTCILDVLGNNTGQATLNIEIDGGTPPYFISGGSIGQTVNHEDIIEVTVTDSNGCTSVMESININCPPFNYENPDPIPDPQVCNDIQFTYNSTLLGKKIDFTRTEFTLNYSVLGLPSMGAAFASIGFTITDNLGAGVLSGQTAVIKTTSSGVLKFEYNTNPDPNIGAYDLNISVEVVLSNGCEYSYIYNESGINSSLTTTLLDSESYTFNL